MQSKPINILLIEDSMEDTIIIREMLNDSSKIPFQLSYVDRLKNGFEKIFQESFDLILLDLNLPDSWGFDTFIRTYDQAPELPIVILSGFDDEDVAIRAVREGAQDYLIKGEIDGRLLSRSIYYAIERKNIEKELMKSQKDLRKLIHWHEEELEQTGKKLIMQEQINESLEAEVADMAQKLDMEQSKFDTLINKLPVGILVVDASTGEYILKNNKLEEIWGDEAETDELAEYCYYNGSHADGKPFEIEEWPLTRSITLGEEINDQKIIVSREDGSKCVINNTAIPIKNEDGEIILGLSIFSDITDLDNY